MFILDDVESDEDFDDEDINFIVYFVGGKIYWCIICCFDICYDFFGVGKVF